METDAHFKSLIYHTFWGPQLRSPPSRYPSHNFLRKKRSTSIAHFVLLSKSLVNEPTYNVPQPGRYEGAARLKIIHLHKLQSPQ
jgi:hypothetical protein